MQLFICFQGDLKSYKTPVGFKRFPWEFLNMELRNYTNASAVSEFRFLLALKIYRTCKYTDLILLKTDELPLNCCRSLSSKFWRATGSQQTQHFWGLRAVPFLTSDFTSWNDPKQFPFPSTQIFKAMFWSYIYIPEIQFINTYQINKVFKTKRILKRPILQGIFKESMMPFWPN